MITSLHIALMWSPHGIGILNEGLISELSALVRQELTLKLRGQSEEFPTDPNPRQQRSRLAHSPDATKRFSKKTSGRKTVLLLGYCKRDRNRMGGTPGPKGRST